MSVYSYVPKNATATSNASIVIDFQLYRDDKCQLNNISKTGIVRKVLKFFMRVGQCKDISELQYYLRGSNLQDLSKEEAYQKLLPEDAEMKIYEVWHAQHSPERILFSYSGNTFYPVLILSTH